MQDFKFDLYDNTDGNYCFSVKKNDESIEQAERVVKKEYKDNYSVDRSDENNFKAREYIKVD